MEAGGWSKRSSSILIFSFSPTLTVPPTVSVAVPAVSTVLFVIVVFSGICTSVLVKVFTVCSAEVFDFFESLRLGFHFSNLLILLPLPFFSAPGRRSSSS